MKVKWNGHSSFTITSDSGTRIVTDPYEPGGFGGGIKYEPIPDQADIVLVSHEHADHNYVKGLKGSPKVIKSSSEHKGIKITGVPAFHDSNQGKERGQNLLFIFEVDGIRIGFLGDLGHLPDAAQLKHLSETDLLFVPVGGFFTIDAKEAAKLVDTVKPKVAVPMHYKTAKVNFPITNADEFLAHFTKVKKIDGSEFEVKKSELPKSTEVWVLNHAC